MGAWATARTALWASSGSSGSPGRVGKEMRFVVKSKMRHVPHLVTVDKQPQASLVSVLLSFPCSFQHWRNVSILKKQDGRGPPSVSFLLPLGPYRLCLFRAVRRTSSLQSLQSFFSKWQSVNFRFSSVLSLFSVCRASPERPVRPSNPTKGRRRTCAPCAEDPFVPAKTVRTHLHTRLRGTGGDGVSQRMCAATGSHQSSSFASSLASASSDAGAFFLESPS